MSDLLINVAITGGKEAYSTMESINESASKATSSLDSLQDVLSKLEKTQKSFKTESEKLPKQQKDLADANKAVTKGIEELNKGLISSTQFTVRYGKAVNDLKNDIKSSYGENLKYEKSIDDVTEALNKSTAAEKKAEASKNKFAGTLKTVKAAAIGYATVLTAMEMQSFISDTIKAGIQLDSLQRTFKAITGSEKEAAEEMQFLTKTADDLGLELSILEKSYKGILAASKNTSLEGQGIRDVFLSVSKAATVLGMSSDEVEGTLRALSQMISKGNVQAEELRGQLGERLPGAFQMAAEAIGVSTQKLNDMLENGEVLAEDLLPKLADVLEGRFGEAAIESADSAQAHFNRLKNEVLELQRAVGESGLIEEMADLAKETKSFLETNQDLIKNELGTFFQIATFNAKLFLETLSGISNKLDQIGAIGDKAAELMFGSADATERATAEMNRLKDSIVTLEESITMTTDPDKIEKYEKQISVLSDAIKRWELTYEDLEKTQTEANDKFVIDAQQTSIIYNQMYGEIQKQEAVLYKVREELRKHNLDEIDKEKEEEIKKAKEFYAKQISELKKYLGDNHEIYKVLEDQKNVDIQAAEEKASEARQEILDKETKNIKKEYEKRLKNLDKALEETFGEIDKHHEEILDIHEDFQKKYDKATLSDYEYKVYLLDKDRAKFEQNEEDKTKIFEWYVAKRTEIENDRIEEEQKAAQKAYDDLYEDAEDFTDRIVDNWDDMGDTLVDMAEEMVTDIAKKFLTEAIVMPVYMSIIGDTGSYTTGTYTTDLLTTDTSSTYGIDLGVLSDLSSLYSLMSGNTATTVGTALSSGIVGSVGESIFGAELWGTYGGIEAGTGAVASSGIVGTIAENSFYGILGSLGYTYLGDWLGLPQGEYSGIGAGVGAVGGAAAGTAITSGTAYGSYGGPIGAIVGAVVGGIVAAFAGGSDRYHEADLMFGFGLEEESDIYKMFTGSEWGSVSELSYGSFINISPRDSAIPESEIEEYMSSFMEEVFLYLDGTIGGSLEDIMREDPFHLIGQDWADDIDHYFEDEEGVESLLQDLTDSFVEHYADELFEGLGLSSEYFNLDFLESIQVEDIGLLGTFANFIAVTEAFDDFVGEINRRSEEFGETGTEAFANMLAVVEVLYQLEEGVAGITTVSSITAIDELTDSWQSLIESLEEVHATTEQITEAESDMAQVLGANITGLTADALQSALMQGGDIDSIIQSAIQSAGYAEIAQQISTSYIATLNEEVGAAWVESEGDIQAVVEVMQNIDTTDAQNEILELQEAFGLIAETTGEVEGVAEAIRAVTLAIEGQLSASQKFEEWQIDNLEALALFSEMTVDSVTQEELEGAIDAFIDLGLEGDDLNNVIQDLADAFTDATNEMLQNIANIEDAQADLLGEDEDYIQNIADAFSFFTDPPSIEQIRGDEPVLQTYLDEEAYKQAFAEYVVDVEFQTILGREADDSGWYVEQLLGGSISFEDITEAIRGGISSATDTVDEIYMRLFGRVAEDDYWVDLLEQGTYTYENIEQAIINAAQGADLIALEEGIDQTFYDWEGFDAFDSLTDHLNYFSDMITDFTEEDFIIEEYVTLEGEFSTSEQEVLDALDILGSLEDVITESGKVDQTALDAFIETIGTMDSAVLEDIFGSEAAEQINDLTSAYNDYQTSLEDGSSLLSDEIDITNAQRELEIQILREQGEYEEALGLEREGILDDLTNTYGDQADVLIALQEELWSLTDANAILSAERELEIQILEAQGDTEAALAMQREDIIADLEEAYGSEAKSIIALQEELWALQDANAILSAERELEIQILEAQGNTEAALAMQREDIIADLEEAYGSEADSIIALQEELWALQDATEALEEAEAERESAAQNYLSALEDELAILEGNLDDAKGVYLDLLNDELNAQEELASSLESAIENIQDFRKELEFNYDLEEPLDIQASLLKEQTEIIEGILSGDVDSVSDLISISKDYLDVTKGLSKSETDYAIEVAKTNIKMSNVEDSLSDQLTEAEQQIELFSSLIDEVNGVSNDILSLEEAEAAYQDAKTELDNNWYTDEIEMLNDLLYSNEGLEELLADFITWNIAAIEAGGEGAAGFEEETSYAQSLADAAEIYYNIELGTAPGLDIFEAMQLIGVLNADILREEIGYTGDVEELKERFGFATGGSFEVQGESGRDALALPGLRVTAGEIVNISRPDTMDSLSSAINYLLEELKNLRSDQRAQALAIVRLLQDIDDNTDYLELWDEIGMPQEQTA